MDYLAFSSGIFYTIAFSVIFYSVFRQSSFWVLFISIEYFYLIGLGVFPVALSLGYADFPAALKVYRHSEEMGVLVFAHVFLYALGALFGFFAFPKAYRILALRLEKLSVRLSFDPNRAVQIFLFVAYGSALIYVSVLGAERVLLGASLARGGVLDEFSGFESYLFLTKFLYLGVYAVAFLPYVLTRARYPFLHVVAFVILGVGAYLLISARYMLFQCAILPFLFYIVYSKRFGVPALIALTSILVFVVVGLFYGKELPSVLGGYLFNSDEFEFLKTGERDFFKSFSQFFYSIDAGINNFFRFGPHISLDIILGPLGVIPSSVFSALGLEGFSYILLGSDDRFACVNTEIVTGSYFSCFLPPYYIGAAAYLMPLAGGFVFGFIRFFIYAVVSRCWQRMVGREQYIAIVALILISIEQLMLFIPNSSAFVVFVWLFILFLRATGALRGI